MSSLSDLSITTSLIPSAADRPGDDPIFTLHAEALGRKQAGEDILNATIGALMDSEGKLAVLPSVSEAYRRIPADRASSYAPISGPPRFLAAVIRSLYGDGLMAQRSVAVATPGGTGALHHAIVNFLEPGQKLLTTSYFWEPYAILAAHTRRGVDTFRMFDGDGGFDVDSFQRALGEQLDRQGRSLVVLNTPCHNPTGYSLDADEWERVTEVVESMADRGQVVFLLDYAYAMFAPTGQVVSPRFAERMSERLPVLVAWTASKSFAQYGARVGALVASHADADERQRLKNALGYSCRGTWSNCNHLGMLAITELFEDPELNRASERERDDLRRLLSSRVEAFNQLAQQAGLHYPRYGGGFFVAVFTPNPVVTAARMREEGVYVVPLQGAVRVALCATPVESLPRLVEALKLGVAAAS